MEQRCGLYGPVSQQELAREMSCERARACLQAQKCLRLWEELADLRLPDRLDREWHERRDV